MGMIQRWFSNLAEKAISQSDATVDQLLTPVPGASLLDVGCWDGENSKRWANRVQPSEIWGLEGNASAASTALKNGIRVQVFDLDSGIWPVADDQFDVVVANQVIEHVDRVDHFLREIRRVMKPNGYAVISTENLASWHNVFALSLGWQPFSITNYSEHGSVGNPLALHRQGNNTGMWESRGTSWMHRRVFARKGWIEVLALNGLQLTAEGASGYYPLPAIVAKLDPRHGHYWTARVTRLG